MNLVRNNTFVHGGCHGNNNSFLPKVDTCGSTNNIFNFDRKGSGEMITWCAQSEYQSPSQRTDCEAVDRWYRLVGCLQHGDETSVSLKTVIFLTDSAINNSSSK
jgi:hypothetical protein